MFHKSWLKPRVCLLTCPAQHDRDNKINQRLVVKQLKRAGYVVTTFVQRVRFAFAGSRLISVRI